MSDHTFYSYLADSFSADNIYSVFHQIESLILSYLTVSFGDIQSTVFLCLLVWFLINVVLIKIAWTFYGDRICQKFLRQG